MGWDGVGCGVAGTRCGVDSISDALPYSPCHLPCFVLMCFLSCLLQVLWCDKHSTLISFMSNSTTPIETLTGKMRGRPQHQP